MTTTLRRRLLAALAVLACAVTGIAVAPGTANAGTGMLYNVIDADNDPYSGIYLRNGTSMAQVDRVTSRYMLYGTRIELVCFSEGESVGPFNNRLWHKVYVPGGYASGQTGWVADRYLDTPIKANERVKGEPDCNGGGNTAPVLTPVPNTRGAIYYSPFQNGEYMPGDTTVNIPRSSWSYGQSWNYQAQYYMHRIGLGSVPAPNCDMGKVNNVPTFNVNSVRPVTSVAGWSAGRIGAISRVKSAGGSINYMLLIDPGSYNELKVYGCDSRIGAGDILYNWLNNNPGARLVILAGAVTRDIDTAKNGYAHRGIQEAYFTRIRQNARVAGQVLVCNYNGTGHEDMFNRYRNRIDDNPLTSCPDGGAAWRP